MTVVPRVATLALLAFATMQVISGNVQRDGSSIDADFSGSELRGTVRTNTVKRIESHLQILAFALVAPLARMTRVFASVQAISKIESLA